MHAPTLYIHVPANDHFYVAMSFCVGIMFLITSVSKCHQAECDYTHTRVPSVTTTQHLPIGETTSLVLLGSLFGSCALYYYE